MCIAWQLLDENAFIAEAWRDERGDDDGDDGGADVDRPERVQFYGVAASGPHLRGSLISAACGRGGGGFDAEGVARLIAMVQSIAAERDRIFTTRGLDMMMVREASSAWR